MNDWHFYDPVTGRLSRRTYSGHERDLAGNTPPGHVPIAGRLDPATQYVAMADVATSVVTSRYLEREQWITAAVETVTVRVPVVTPRPTSPAVFAVSSGNVLRVDSLPPGATVTVDGDADPVTYAPTSGWLEIEFDTGVYKVAVQAFPYLDASSRWTF